MRYLFFDTATTSKYQFKARLIYLTYLEADEKGNVLDRGHFYVQPEGFQIDNEEVHGIGQAKAIAKGSPVGEVLKTFLPKVKTADLLIAHNVEYDKKVLFNELRALAWNKTYFTLLYNKPTLCTMEATTEFCDLRDNDQIRPKFPRLAELHEKLFDQPYLRKSKLPDVEVVKRCFFELKKLEVIG